MDVAYIFVVFVTLLHICRGLDFQGATPVLKDSWTQILPNSVITLKLSFANFTNAVKPSQPPEPPEPAEKPWYSFFFALPRDSEADLPANISHHEPKDEDSGPQLKWVPIGHPSVDILQPLRAPFDAISLSITSTHPLYIYWADHPHPYASALSTLHHARCQQPFWPFFSSSVLNCDITLPKYGWTAPLGRSHIGFVPATVVEEHEHATRGSWWGALRSAAGLLHGSADGREVTVSISYNTHKDWFAVARMGIGLALFATAPLFAASRKAHVAAGALAGSLGVVVLLVFLLLRVIPAKRRIIGVSAALGVAAGVLGWLRDAVVSLLYDNELLVGAVVLVGALVGAVCAYRWRLSTESSEVLLCSLRALALTLVVTGAHNILVAGTVAVCLLVRWCLCGSCTDSDADAFENAEDASPDAHMHLQLVDSPAAARGGWCWRRNRALPSDACSPERPAYPGSRRAAFLPLAFDADTYGRAQDPDVVACVDGAGAHLDSSAAEHMEENCEDDWEDEGMAAPWAGPEFARQLEDRYSDYSDYSEDLSQWYPDPEDEDDGSAAADAYAQAAGGVAHLQSLRDFELQGRLYTQEQLRRLRAQLRRDGGAHLQHMSSRTIHAVMRDLVEHEASDAEWEAEWAECSTPPERATTRGGPDLGFLGTGAEPQLRARVHRSVSKAASARVGARYHDVDPLGGAVDAAVDRVVADAQEYGFLRRRTQSHLPAHGRGVGVSREADAWRAQSTHTQGRSTSAQGAHWPPRAGQPMASPPAGTPRDGQAGAGRNGGFARDWERLFTRT